MVTASPLLKLDGIGKRYPGVVALHDVSFVVKRGEFHSICGENGAGKSTLMKILSGVVTDYEGDILINGQPVTFETTNDAEQAGIAIIHQELNLVEQLSISANIFLGREKRRGFFLDEQTMHQETKRLLAKLESTLDPQTPVSELRVGDQQLVEIAKALSLNAEILIMDEPTSALTETEVERLFRVIEGLQASGVTILYISHKMEEVFRASQTITVLRDGRHIKTQAASETSPRDILHQLVGRELGESTRTQSYATGKTILQVRNLSLPRKNKSLPPRLENISFELQAGEVLGFAGLMGAGRTELLECLFGANDETLSGDILIDGQPVKLQHPADAKALGIAMVTEDRKRSGLFAQMTVRENISICTLEDLRHWGLIQAGKESRLAINSIAKVRVKTAGSEAAITGLSGGNQQKCIIARWLTTNPRILLLDDPTRGIDVGAKAELYDIINELSREGLAIIVTSSELPELITLCDRIMVLCEGRLTGELARHEFSEQHIMECATSQKMPVP